MQLICSQINKQLIQVKFFFYVRWDFLMHKNINALSHYCSSEDFKDRLLIEVQNAA